MVQLISIHFPTNQFLSYYVFLIYILIFINQIFNSFKMQTTTHFNKYVVVSIQILIITINFMANVYHTPIWREYVLEHKQNVWTSYLYTRSLWERYSALCRAFHHPRLYTRSRRERYDRRTYRRIYVCHISILAPMGSDTQVGDEPADFYMFLYTLPQGALL